MKPFVLLLDLPWQESPLKRSFTEEREWVPLREDDTGLHFRGMYLIFLVVLGCISSLNGTYLIYQLRLEML